MANHTHPDPEMTINGYGVRHLFPRKRELPLEVRKLTVINRVYAKTSIGRDRIAASRAGAEACE